MGTTARPPATHPGAPPVLPGGLAGNAHGPQHTWPGADNDPEREFSDREAQWTEEFIEARKIVMAVAQEKTVRPDLKALADGAHNGSDHVDAHRTVALCVSPDTQHGKVDSTMYSTSSMLRTMELILGLRPMSQFDAAATPMYAAFQKEPNLDAYAHVAPDVDMKPVNSKKAFGAALAETWDFTKEDQIDDLIFNEVIWRSVKVADSPMPPPVRAAFVFPHLPAEEEKASKK